jgi:hypothetical protein
LIDRLVVEAPTVRVGKLFMGDVGLLWLSGALLAIGVASLAATILIVWRRSKKTTVAPLMAVMPERPCRGPIGKLDFYQSLDPMLFARAAEEEALAFACLYRKSNPNVLVMQPTDMRLRNNPADALNFARNRGVLVQRQMRTGLVVICHVRS